jgi:hypothetical protein
MTTKQRFRNKYRLQLREKDHEPMHVHLVGGNINAKIDLSTDLWQSHNAQNEKLTGSAIVAWSY